MASLPEQPATLDIREQVARIDKMQAELQKIFEETVKTRLDGRKVELDMRFAPWTLLAIGAGASAALIAAGAALAKLMIG